MPEVPHARRASLMLLLRHHEATRTYAARRTAQGLSKNEIIRCLKRFVAREIYRVLTTPPPARTKRNDLAQAA